MEQNDSKFARIMNNLDSESSSEHDDEQVVAVVDGEDNLEDKRKVQKVKIND